MPLEVCAPLEKGECVQQDVSGQNTWPGAPALAPVLNQEFPPGLSDFFFPTLGNHYRKFPTPGFFFFPTMSPFYQLDAALCCLSCTSWPYTNIAEIQTPD